MMKKKTLEKNPSNQKPEGRGEKGRGVKMLHTYIHTDRHTEPPTKRVLEEHSLLKIKPTS